MSITVSATRAPIASFRIEGQIVHFWTQLSSVTKNGQPLTLAVPCSSYVSDTNFLAQLSQLDPEQVYEGSFSGGSLYIKKDRLTSGGSLLNALAIDVRDFWIPVLAPGCVSMGRGKGPGHIDFCPECTVTGFPGKDVKTGSFGDNRTFVSGSVQGTSTKNGDNWENLWIDWAFFENKSGMNKGVRAFAEASVGGGVSSIEVHGKLALGGYQSDEGFVMKLQLTGCHRIDMVKQKAAGGGYTAAGTPPSAAPAAFGGGGFSAPPPPPAATSFAPPPAASFAPPPTTSFAPPPAVAPSGDPDVTGFAQNFGGTVTEQPGYDDIPF